MIVSDLLECFRLNCPIINPVTTAFFLVNLGRNGKEGEKQTKVICKHSCKTIKVCGGGQCCFSFFFFLFWLIKCLRQVPVLPNWIHLLKCLWDLWIKLLAFDIHFSKQNQVIFHRKCKSEKGHLAKISVARFSVPFLPSFSPSLAVFWKGKPRKIQNWQSEIT